MSFYACMSVCEHARVCVGALGIVVALVGVILYNLSSAGKETPLNKGKEDSSV